jgi:hypothetical protein
MRNLVDSATLAVGLWEFKFSLSKVLLRLLYARRRLLSARAGAEAPPRSNDLLFSIGYIIYQFYLID